MKTVLRIDASSRTTGSQSRALGDYFERAWLNRNSGNRFVRRDIVETPIPHISSQTIAGFYTPSDQLTDDLRGATALSDKLIDELLAADVLLLTVPVYNFSTPSALKAWIDQIVRVGRTFSYDGNSFTGLVTGKRAYVICAYGASGYLGNGPLAAYDFLKPYLTQLLNFLGIQDIHFFAVEGTTMDEHTVKASADKVKLEIANAIG
ncbi:MAG TPA: NAD(P)H-dependent oxidoreductase [Thiobacillus sp.]|nr:NAD(P)H-dependent oxidoreductase [Thiobacillus sp.]